MNLYSIFDHASKTYSTPYSAHNNAIAMRYFQESCQAEDSNLHKYPKDFELVLIGKFNTDDGQIEAVNIQTIAHATDFQHDTTST